MEVKETINLENSSSSGVGLGIVLSGKASVGKDVIANILVKEYGFKKYSFADSIKELCSKKYGYPLEWNYSREGKQRVVSETGGKTVRELLINEGIKIRQRDPLALVKNVVTKLMNDRPPFYVITDCRFRNEAEVFSYFNGVLVRINADRESRLKWGCDLKIVDSKDPTETDLDGYEGFNLEYDIVYGVNNYDLVENIMEEIYGKGI